MTRSTIGTPARRRSARGAALLAFTAAALAGVLSGCSAGTVTQTDTQVAAIVGVDAQSRDGKIAVRDVQVVYAKEYRAGGTAPLRVRIFNDSVLPVTLTAVSVKSGGTAVLVGGEPASPSDSASTPASSSPTAAESRRPNGSASANPSGSGTASLATPTTPAVTPTKRALPGSANISIAIPVASYVLLVPGDTPQHLAIAGLPEKLSAGDTVELTLTFTYSDGSTTAIESLRVPVAVPSSSLPRPSPVVKDEH